MTGVVYSVRTCEGGLVRDRGMARTSTTSRTPASLNKPTNSAIEQVECPMVKNGGGVLASYIYEQARYFWRFFAISAANAETRLGWLGPQCGSDESPQRRDRALNANFLLNETRNSDARTGNFT